MPISDDVALGQNVKIFHPSLVNLYGCSVGDDSKIGELPVTWNYLVGEYDHQPDVSLIHYTLGGPYFDDYRSCDYSTEWFREREQLSNVKQKVQAAT